MMAIDTAAKRRSAAGIKPIHKAAIIPDGTIGATDRIAIAWLYNGLVSAPGELLKIAVSTTLYRNISLSTTLYRKILTVSALYRNIKIQGALYQSINTVTTLYRKIKTITTGG